MLDDYDYFEGKPTSQFPVCIPRYILIILAVMWAITGAYIVVVELDNRNKTAAMEQLLDINLPVSQPPEYKITHITDTTTFPVRDMALNYMVRCDQNIGDITNE